MSKEVCLVYGTVPQAELRVSLSEVLLQQHHAACVHFLPAIEAVFRWEGVVHKRQEYPFLIKTTQRCLQSIMATIVELHPDSCPGVVSVPVSDGYAPFLQWIDDETEKK